MKVSCLFLCFVFLTFNLLWARTGDAQNIDDVTVMVSLKNESLKTALRQIERQSSYKFAFVESQISSYSNLFLAKQKRSIKNTLDELLENTSLKYVVANTTIVIVKKHTGNDAVSTTNDFANDESETYRTMRLKPIAGVVLNENGEPLAGASINVKNTSRYAVSNERGEFEIEVETENSILIVSYTGYESKEIPIENSERISIRLTPTNQTLTDVVVIGYGSVKKRDLTGAVATVRGEQLRQVATADPVQALQGRVAGVEITSNSGQPGSGTRIRVRGVGTINNSNPLYVVDGFQTGNINFLMPDDIESIEILKDASATAIYGSRGANGVVLVTTKRGKAGKPKFNFNGYTGFQQVWKKLDLVDAAGYATLVSEAYANEGQPIPANIADRLKMAIQTNAVGADWLDAVTQNGKINNYNLSVSGGTEQNRYFVSGSYFQQDGTVKSTGLKKYVIRVNDDLALSKRIKAGISVNFTRSNNLGYNNLTRTAVLANPIIPINTADGKYAYDDMTNAINVVRQTEDQKTNETENSNLLANLFIDVKLLRNLSFRTDFGIGYNNIHGKAFLPQFFIGLNDQRSVSSLSENRNESVGWVWANYLNYNKKFLSGHTLSLTVGEEAQRSYGNGLSLTAFDVPSEVSLQYISAARSNTATFTSTQQDESLLSFFTRANYEFKSKYLLTGTLRYDGSSKFLSSVRWGLFPSFGAAWRISEENFLKNIKAISSLKLRAGWGKVGNQNAAPNYAYVATARNNMNYVFNNIIAPGMIPTQLGNPNLKWETAISSNAGLDAGLFNDKLSLTADYFIKKTEDMIALLPVADYIGSAPPSANVASMQNKGFEFALTYKNSINKFRYEAGINFTKIHNEVTDLGGASALASGNVISQMGNTTLTNIGYEIAYFYGLKTNGIFKSQEEVASYKNSSNTAIQPNAKPGDVRFVDLNGDGKISNLDKTYLGSYSNLDFSYGISLNLGYSNFDFRLLLYGVQGAEAVNGLSRYLLKTSNSTGSWNNFYAVRLNRWTPANPNSDQPRITTRDLNGNDQFSDRFVENGSYLRARNVEIGYTLPATILSKMKVNSLRINLSIDNLFTWTKYSGFDPEISEAGFFNDPLAYGVDFGNYPQPRTYRVGLNIQF